MIHLAQKVYTEQKIRLARILHREKVARNLHKEKIGLDLAEVTNKPDLVGTTNSCKARLTNKDKRTYTKLAYTVRWDTILHLKSGVLKVNNARSKDRAKLTCLTCKIPLKVQDRETIFL